MTFSSTQSPEESCLQSEVWLQPALLYSFCSEAVWGEHRQLCAGDISNSCSGTVWMVSVPTECVLLKLCLCMGTSMELWEDNAIANEKNMSLIIKIIVTRWKYCAMSENINHLTKDLLTFLFPFFSFLFSTIFAKLRFYQQNFCLKEKLLDLHS